MENIPANIEIPETKPLPVPQPWDLRLYYGIAVTLLPVISFSLIGVLEPNWQSGKFPDYVTLLLAPPASRVFFPLLIYSSLSLLYLLFSPRRFAESFVIRFGIYTGTILAYQFTILTLLALFNNILVVVSLWVVPYVFAGLYRWLAKRVWARILNLIGYALVGLMLLVFASPILMRALRLDSSIFSGANGIFSLMYLLIGIFPVSAPLWSMLIMGKTSYQLIKHYETKFTFLRGIGLLAWLSGFIAAWRLAILKTLELYAALPPEPPNCYIATAATNGHKQLVRSHEVELGNGKCMRVNEQLQRLKCAELAMLVIAPHFHAPMRKLYDVLGKRLARRMSNPYLADAAYLLLKPAEWIVFIGMSWLIPETKAIAGRLYRNS